MLTNYWKFPNRNIQTFGFVYHDTNGQNHGPLWNTQSFLLSEICTPLAGLLWEKQFEKILLQHGWEKVSNWECLIVHREKRWFLSVYVDDIKLAGKKQNINPMWKRRSWFGRTNIIPWSCIPGVYSKTMWNKQRYCWQLQNHVWITNFRRRNWKITMLGKSGYFFVVYDMEGHAKKCVERSCEMANKTTQQLYKVSTPCIDDHHFKEEEMKSVGELSHVCSQIVLKCL